MLRPLQPAHLGRGTVSGWGPNTPGPPISKSPVRLMRLISYRRHPGLYRETHEFPPVGQMAKPGKSGLANGDIAAKFAPTRIPSGHDLSAHATVPFGYRRRTPQFGEVRSKTTVALRVNLTACPNKKSPDGLGSPTGASPSPYSGPLEQLSVLALTAAAVSRRWHHPRRSDAPPAGTRRFRRTCCRTRTTDEPSPPARSAAESAARSDVRRAPRSPRR